RGGRAQRLRRRARHSRAHPAADVDQLRRVEPAAGESRDGRDGFARGSIPAADGVAESGVEGKDQQGAQGARASQGRFGLRTASKDRQPPTQKEREPLGERMLENDIKDLVAAGAAADREKARAVFAQLREALSAGTVRAAEPDPSNDIGWRVNAWVKQGILLGFKFVEPVGALPVIVEDDVLVGGNTGIYEGAIVKSRAVVAAGTVLTGSTPVYDLVRGEIIKPSADRPLVIPEGAVVVPGARAVTSGK